MDAMGYRYSEALKGCCFFFQFSTPQVIFGIEKSVVADHMHAATEHDGQCLFKIVCWKPWKRSRIWICPVERQTFGNLWRERCTLSTLKVWYKKRPVVASEVIHIVREWLPISSMGLVSGIFIPTFTIGSNHLLSMYIPTFTMKFHLKW